MNKSLIEELMEAKHKYDKVLASVFNDGKVRKDEKYMADRLEDDIKSDQFYLITDTMKDATRMYSLGYEFDTISINLLLGLIYNVNDLDENDKVKENAQPVDGIVRFYTGNVTSYLDGEKTNKYEYDYGRQGFIKFDKLMSDISNSGLEYTGPNSFEELKERILSDEQFGIVLTASLKEKEDQVVAPKVKEEVVVEEKPIEEKPKSKVKRFFGL